MKVNLHFEIISDSAFSDSAETGSILVCGMVPPLALSPYPQFFLVLQLASPFKKKKKKKKTQTKLDDFSFKLTNFCTL